jgi:RimK family alpha-L-glutamate ligase
MKAPKFKEFIAEAETDKKPYRLVILSHDEGDESNTSGELVKKIGEKIGIKTVLVEFKGLYTHYEANQQFINSFPVKEGKTNYPTPQSVGRGKVDIYAKPVPISPENTILMVRGVGRPGLSGNYSWYDKCKKWEHEGYTLINNMLCHNLCSDKVMTQIIFERHDFSTPKTVLVTHSEDTERALKELDSEFPIILKTGTGTNGIGVILVESAKSLQSIVQLLTSPFNRDNEYTDILLQEYIKSDYDVRVVVLKEEVIGAIKRPVVKGDFRSNISQGSIPSPHKLTKLEEEEALRAAQAVEGILVGVDFIPAKNREKDPPYLLEVNNVPGLSGIEEALKSEGSVVEKVLKKLHDKSLWKQ